MVDEVIKAKASLTIGGLDLVATAPTLTLKDSSVVPSYAVGWFSDAAGTTAITSANEGSTIYLVLKTTSIYNGNQFTYALTGTGVNVTDLTTGSLTGTLTIQNNIASVSFVMSNDITTEGNETITATVKRNTTTVGTSNITINDTSKTPTYAVGWYTNSTGTTVASSINEGAVVYAVVKTTNVANGTNLSYTLSGSGVNTTDTTIALTGNITINDNIGYITVTPKADTATEGNETLTITVKNGSTTVGTSNITINDTSKTPTYDVGWYTNTTGTTSATEVAEGSTVYAVVKTTNVVNGTTLPYTLSGTGINTNDTTIALTGNITINNNIGYITVTPKDDAVTEGNETLSIQIKAGNTIVANKTLTINDTSVSAGTPYMFYSSDGYVDMGSTIYMSNPPSNFVYRLIADDVQITTNIPGEEYPYGTWMDEPAGEGFGYFINNIEYSTISAPFYPVPAIGETARITVNLRYLGSGLSTSRTFTIVNDLALLIANFTGDTRTHTYRVTQPYGSHDVNAYEYWELIGYCEGDAFKAVHTFQYFDDFNPSIGTPGPRTLSLGGFSHEVRWLFRLGDVYEEEGEGQQVDVLGTYLDLPTNKFVSLVIDLTVGTTTRRGTFTRIDPNNPAKGYISQDNMYSYWYDDTDNQPITMNVISWVSA